MLNSTQSATGNGNIQINGNHDTVNYSQTINCYSSADMRPHRLTHSYIHELLDIVNSSFSSDNNEYSLQNPVQIHEKLRFNNAPRYKLYIDNHVENYIRVDEVMKNYSNSESIVMALHDMFIDVANLDEKGHPCVGDGDSQLNRIKDYINLSKEKTLIEAKRQTLLTKNKRYLSLIDKENIDEYEQLSDNLMQLRQRIGKCEEIIDTLVRYENNLTSLQENIESYSTGGSERKNGNEIYQIRMDSFNKYFTPLAQKINEENPILVYSPDTHKFPVSFSALSGSSTGTRKSLIAAYDLAYQQFAIANQIQSPHFIVHDVVENVEGDDLRTIINIANGIDAQYIVAVLKEKLDSSHISKAEQEKLTILQLSEDDKLFEGKTVNDRENSKGNILSLPFEF